MQTQSWTGYPFSDTLLSKAIHLYCDVFVSCNTKAFAGHGPIKSRMYLVKQNLEPFALIFVDHDPLSYPFFHF